MTLAYAANDADNHYYEDEAAFTRHLPEEWRTKEDTGPPSTATR